MTYLIKRLALALLVALLATTLLAALVHFIPGDPVKVILGPRATNELSARVRREMQLDEPIPTQIVRFIGGVAQGDFGTDFLSRAPVSQLIGNALPHTIILALVGLGLAALIGIPLGVFSAVRSSTWADAVIGILSVSFVTMPSYVLGLLLLLVFAVQLRWFPAIGVGELSDPLDYLKHLVLPAIALAITWVGYLSRLVRASMLEVISANHIRAAFAMGLPARIVYYKYALRNALIPTVAVLGVGLGNLLGGAIFVEVIFTRPGLGRLILDAINTRNYTVVRGGVLVAALLFVFANLIADLANRYLDPRTRNN